MSPDDYNYGSKKRPSEKDKPAPVKPEIAQSVLAVTLGQRLAKAAPMKRIKKD